MNDLFDVLIGNHVEIGCNVAEIQTQKQEHQSFQETARVKKFSEPNRSFELIFIFVQKINKFYLFIVRELMSTAVNC